MRLASRLRRAPKPVERLIAEPRLQGVTSVRAGRGWSRDEQAALVELVAVHGPQWTRMLRQQLLPVGRTAESARAEWARIQLRSGATQHGGDELGERAAACPNEEPSYVAVFNNTQQQAVELDDALLQSALEAAGRANSEAVLRHDALQAAEGMETEVWLGRHDGKEHSGCGWTRAVTRGSRLTSGTQRAQLVPGSKWAVLARNWRLHECAGKKRTLLLCDFTRAEQILRGRVLRRRQAEGAVITSEAVEADILRWRLTVAERDALHLVFYTDGPAHPTLIGGLASRFYVGGPHTLAGGWMTAREAAWLMGIMCGGDATGVSTVDARLTWEAAESVLCETALWRAVAEGLHAPTARDVVRRTLRRMGRHGVHDEALTFASMGTGAFDGFWLAVRHVAAQARRVWIAESSEERRRIALLVSPGARAHHQARSGAVAAECHVDVLGVTLTCAHVSTRKRAAGSTAAQKRRARMQAAARSMAEMVQAVTQYVTRAGPGSIIMEQTGCLCTHFRGLLRWINRELARLPYTWRVGLADPAAHGGSGKRKRFVWAGVRHS